MDSLAQKAVEEALRGNWKGAVSLNEEILEEDEKNKEALNRLARAYLELGKIPKATSTYKKVIKIDPYNTIAQKALARLQNLRENPGKKPNGHSSPMVMANLFIEEPGKTKLAALLHLGAAHIVSSLDTGQPVSLEPHAHRVSIMNSDSEYIGRLPDDLSRRIIHLCQAGNEYDAYVRSVSPDSVKIFIIETKRAERFKDTPSFPNQDKPGYVSFTSPDSIHDEKPDVRSTEEQGVEE